MLRESEGRMSRSLLQHLKQFAWLGPTTKGKQMEALVRAAAANYLAAQNRVVEAKIALGLAKVEQTRSVTNLLSVLNDGESITVDGVTFRNEQGTVIQQWTA